MHCKVLFQVSMVRFVIWFTSLQNSPAPAWPLSECVGVARCPLLSQTAHGKASWQKLDGLSASLHPLFVCLAKGLKHWRNKETRPLPKGFTVQADVSARASWKFPDTFQWKPASWLNEHGLERVCFPWISPLLLKKGKSQTHKKNSIWKLSSCKRLWPGVAMSFVFPCRDSPWTMDRKKSAGSPGLGSFNRSSELYHEGCCLLSLWAMTNSW